MQQISYLLGRLVSDMELYVVRHGETNYNVQDRYTGSADVPLNETGIKQARELAENLKDITFDIIITSPLLRAKQTAEIISSFHNVFPVEIQGFQERNLGIFEHLTVAETEEKFPKLRARQCTRKIDDAPDGGETIREFDQRIQREISQLCDTYGKKSVLLVCHSFVARVINRQINALTFDEMHNFTLENGTYIKYNI